MEYFKVIEIQMQDFHPRRNVTSLLYNLGRKSYNNNFSIGLNFSNMSVLPVWPVYNNFSQSYCIYLFRVFFPFRIKMQV